MRIVPEPTDTGRIASGPAGIVPPMSELLPIQFTVTDIAELADRPIGRCQWVVVQIRHTDLGAEVVSQSPKLDYSSALLEKREIAKSPLVSYRDEIQIYRITREA